MLLDCDGNFFVLEIGFGMIFFSASTFFLASKANIAERKKFLLALHYLCEGPIYTRVQILIAGISAFNSQYYGEPALRMQKRCSWEKFKVRFSVIKFRNQLLCLVQLFAL